MEEVDCSLRQVKRLIVKTSVGGAALKSGETLTGVFANTKASLGRIGASFFEPFYGVAKDFLNWAMEMLGPVEDWAESMKPLIEDGLVDRIQSSFIPAAQHVWEALKTIAEWIFLSKDWIVPLTVAVATFIVRFHMLVGSSIEFLLYWVLHIAVFVVPLVLVWGIGFRPQWKDFFRTWLLAIFWAVFIISINAWLGTNYGFVNHQPEGASLIDWLGPGQFMLC